MHGLLGTYGECTRINRPPKSFHHATDCNCNMQVDPTILGGMIVDVGDRHMDLSVLARLKQIQAAMVESM